MRQIRTMIHSDDTLLLFEKILLGYFALLTLLIILFSEPFSETYGFIVLNIAFVLMILSVHVFSRRLKYRWMLLHAMPILLFTFIYREAGQLVHLIHEGWFDSCLISLEKTIFGTNPALFVEQFDHPVLNELFRIGYGSFYFLILFGLIIHLRSGNEQDSLRMVSTVTLAFCISYILFIVFPAQGPRFFLEDILTSEMKGLFLSELQRKIIETGGFRGGAFPSSHLASSLLVWFSLFKNHKTAFITYAPFIVLLAIGTVWGRYHYGVDVIAGIIIAVIVWYAYPLIKTKT